MRNTINDLLFGRNTLVNGLIALFVISLIALGCTCGKGLDFGNTSSSSNSNSGSNPFGNSTSSSDSEMPDDSLLNALVKETTADFALAISTEDFSDLYEKASTDFKQTYTLDQTKNVFKDFIDKKRLISPILAKAIAMDPEYSPQPSIRTEKGLSILVTTGKYDTKPVPTRFEYEYVKRGGEWKMLKLVVKLTK